MKQLLATIAGITSLTFTPASAEVTDHSDHETSLVQIFHVDGLIPSELINILALETHYMFTHSLLKLHLTITTSS